MSVVRTEQDRDARAQTGSMAPSVLEGTGEKEWVLWEAGTSAPLAVCLLAMAEKQSTRAAHASAGVNLAELQILAQQRANYQTFGSCQQVRDTA